jgi:hypothetical protein
MNTPESYLVHMDYAFWLHQHDNHDLSFKCCPLNEDLTLDVEKQKDVYELPEKNFFQERQKERVINALLLLIFE